MQIILFTLNDRHYAISTDMVEEISKQIPSTNVPNSPDWVEGIINLRGNVVTLLNLSKLLQQDDSICYNNIIIMNNNDEKIGLMVQEVLQVLDIEPEDIQTLNSDEDDGMLGIVQIGEEIIDILEIEKLLSKNEGFI
jgi:purine-binding chemotaxis protein CheW